MGKFSFYTNNNNISLHKQRFHIRILIILLQHIEYAHYIIVIPLLQMMCCSNSLRYLKNNQQIPNVYNYFR